MQTPTTPNPAPSTPPWELDDKRLLAECDCHTYRASGPGGQKRNVTESAVRLRHRPSGVTTVGTESRSQAENRRRALRRLRLALAVFMRRPVEPAPDISAVWVNDSGRVAVNPRHPRFAAIVAATLDLLEDRAGRISDVADRFGLSTSQLVRFLKREPLVWTEANRIRARHGLSPLK